MNLELTLSAHVIIIGFGWEKFRVGKDNTILGQVETKKMKRHSKTSVHIHVWINPYAHGQQVACYSVFSGLWLGKKY